MKRFGLIFVLIISLFSVVSWTSPEGTEINVYVTTVTDAQVYQWLKDVGLQTHIRLVRIDVVDIGKVVALIGCDYVGTPQQRPADAIIQADDESLLAHPWYSLGHEYGHVWTNYYKCLYWDDRWDDWATARGFPLERATNDISCWNPQELAASDYRKLFAHPETTPGVIVANFASQCGLAEPENITDYRDWLALIFTQGHPPPGYGISSTPTPTIVITSTPTPILTVIPTTTRTPTPVGTCFPPKARRCR